MEVEHNAQAFAQAAQVLPQRLRREALLLSPGEQARAEELRLRAGWPMTVVFPEGEYSLGGPPVANGELDQLVELASHASVHAVLDQIRRGYLTVEGGHRIGLCGTAVLREGEVHNLRRLSSAAVRVARQVPGVSRALWERLKRGDGALANTLILAPPGMGKTTLLRDLIWCVSEGEGLVPQRVGVADERGEIAAMWNGCPQLAVGRRTDVVEGCPKSQGLMLLRAMNPQVLAVDEITAPEDVGAMCSAAGCGVTLLATAHGWGRSDLERRALYREMMQGRLFEKLVRIFRVDGVRQYQVEELRI